METDPLHDQRFYVYGLGASGLAVADHLKSKGARVWTGDDGPARHPALPFVPSDEVDWAKVDVLVPAPGLPHSHHVVQQALQQNIAVLGECEIYAWSLLLSDRAPRVVAVTGTNGKSTVTALIAHILNNEENKVVAGGNLGVPLLKLDMGADIHVVELSSFQLDLQTSFAADVAVLTNLGVDHLDRHGTVDRYHHAKLTLFQQTGMQGGRLVLPSQDLPSLGWVEEGKLSPVGCFYVGEGHPQSALYFDGDCLVHQNRSLPLVIPLSLKGEHNKQNILNALAAGLCLGYDLENLLVKLASFPGLEHRLEYLGANRGVQFVNDSKATNATSACWALRAWPNAYWLVGGLAKKEDYQPLVDVARDMHARAFCFGHDGAMLAGLLDGSVPTRLCDTLDEAFKLATQQAICDGGGVVLLAPGCASFDAFEHFAHRGQFFKDLVRGETW